LFWRRSANVAWLNWVEQRGLGGAIGKRHTRRSHIRKDGIPTVDINGTHRFAAGRQAVWDALHNSAVLQKSIPGAQEVAWQGTSAISARIHIGIGPINGDYEGQVQVVENSAPSHLKLAINRTSLQAEANIDLADDGAGTMLTYQANAKMSGVLAMADNVIGKQAAQLALGQFFKSFEQNIA
jgi:carbon monoxide dehydrogenase subunit G